MKVSDRFGGTFLKAGHVEKPLLLTITKVVEEAMAGDPRNIKPVVYVAESDKGVVLNATIANALAAYLGDDTETWPGGKFVLFPTRCDFQGKQVDCLRVREPRKRQAETSPPAAQIEDDCPF